MDHILIAENIGCIADSNELLLRKDDGKEILKNISFSLKRNSILGISGESGSGKTTLSKIAAGIRKPSAGKITHNFKNDWKRIKSSPVQILFQNNGEILNPLRQIDQIVEESISIRNGSGSNKKENAQNVTARKEEIFQLLNFPEHLWQRKGYQLSGGEQQRGALARILAAKPELLVLDEPFSAQDPESQFNLFKLFKRINKELNITLICVAHNLRILKKLCDEIMILYEGEILELESTQKIFESPKHPYTKFLIKAEGYDLSSEKLHFDSSS